MYGGEREVRGEDVEGVSRGGAETRRGGEGFVWPQRAGEAGDRDGMESRGERVEGEGIGRREGKGRMGVNIVLNPTITP